MCGHLVVMSWNVNKVPWGKRDTFLDPLDVWAPDWDILLLQEVFIEGEVLPASDLPDHTLYVGEHLCFYTPGDRGIHGVAIVINRRHLRDNIVGPVVHNPFLISCQLNCRGKQYACLSSYMLQSHWGMEVFNKQMDDIHKAIKFIHKQNKHLKILLGTDGNMHMGSANSMEDEQYLGLYGGQYRDERGYRY